MMSFELLIENTLRGLDAGGPLVFFLVFLVGIITSLSPCVLSVLPIMVGYIGGQGSISRLKGFYLSLLFVVGMAITLSLLGMAASLFGQIFEQTGTWWYYVLAAVAILMGLRLLDVIHFQFPTLAKMPSVQMSLGGTILMGMAFGLVMSPCTTPVLAVLLTYVAARGDLGYSTALLFSYGLGHGLLLLVAGTFTSFLKGLPALRERTRFLTSLSGVLLILAGFYLLLLTW